MKSERYKVEKALSRRQTVKGKCEQLKVKGKHINKKTEDIKGGPNKP